MRQHQSKDCAIDATAKSQGSILHMFDSRSGRAPSSRRHAASEEGHGKNGVQVGRNRQTGDGLLRMRQQARQQDDGARAPGLQHL